MRYVGNRSSGRMGLALASAARARGAHVTVVSANVALPWPQGVERREVVTAAELQRACEEEFPRCDILLMAAAVADFRPVSPSAEKLKKEGRERLELQLEPTPDVLSTLAARRRPGQTIVGFAAEHGSQTIPNARAKLEHKALDVVVANDVSHPGTGFEAEHNEVTVLTGSGEVALARAPKSVIAEGILDVLEQLRSRAGATVDEDARAPRGQRLRAL